MVLRSPVMRCTSAALILGQRPPENEKTISGCERGMTLCSLSRRLRGNADRARISKRRPLGKIAVEFKKDQRRSLQFTCFRLLHDVATYILFISSVICCASGLTRHTNLRVPKIVTLETPGRSRNPQPPSDATHSSQERVTVLCLSALFWWGPWAG